MRWSTGCAEPPPGARWALRHICTPLQGIGGVPTSPSRSKHVEGEVEVDNLEFYLELASDDNRSNLTDLIAHWDHTLGYLVGVSKYSYLNNNPFFVEHSYPVFKLVTIYI